MAYTKTNWAGGLQITADLMNKIETELESLDTKVGDNSAGLVKEITDARDGNSNLNTRLDSIENDISGLNTTLQSVQTSVTNVSQSVSGFVTQTTFDNQIASLNTVDTNLTARVAEITNAHRDENDTLDKRFDDLEAALSSSASGLSSRVETLETTVGNSSSGLVKEVTDARGNENSLNARLDAMDTTIAGKAASSDLADKLSKITANGLLKGDGNGGITAAVAGTDYLVSHQDISGKADASALETLSGSVLTLSNTVSNISTTEIVSNPTYNNHIPSINNPNSKIDYLIKGEGTDTKYYYWKYINNNWELISGGGGSSSSGRTGNNNSVVYATEAAFNTATATNKDVNTDYYVLINDEYHHYRFISDGNDGYTKIEIGQWLDTSYIKLYNMAIRTVEELENNETVVNSYLYLFSINYGSSSNLTTADEDDLIAAKAYVKKIKLPAGGGGGSGILNTAKITRITPRNFYQALNSNQKVELKFFYTSGVENNSATYTVKLNDVPIISNQTITSGDPEDASSTWPEDPVPTGFYSIDVTEYCKSLGVKKFKIETVDEDDDTLTTSSNWEVTVINLNISSTFSENTVVNNGTNIDFTYIPEGGINKVVHFKLDNIEIGTTSFTANVSGTTQQYTISAPQDAGSHLLEVYITATADGRTLESNHIYRDIIWRDTSSSDIIISSPYRGRTVNLTQYDTLIIPYTIVGGAENNYEVKYCVDTTSNIVNEVSLTSINNGTWTYDATSSGNHTLIILVEEESININIVVELLNVDIAPVIGSIIDFNPSGLTNNSQNRLPSWTTTENNSPKTYSLSVSSNFDWYNGGYGVSDEGSYFLIKAGTRAYIDYKMFKNYTEETNGVLETKSAVFRDGAEMKVIFKTAAVRDASAVWLSNVGHPTNNSNIDVGIQLSAHEGWLKTSAAGNTSGDIAATNTYLYFPYSEEDKIELDISINQSATNNNFIMSYEDGVPSKAYPYSTSEMLYHETGSESVITIGSDDCDVYIYRLKIYNQQLTTDDVLRNFIADGKNAAECIQRYNRNSIYYDEVTLKYVPYSSSNAHLNPERLAQRIPDVKVLMLDTPQFTSNKKDFVKNSSLRCIHADGGNVYTSRGAADNWIFTNGYHAGQGTSSDKYGDAGRNVDFLFECDGVHNPSDKVKGSNLDPNYISELTTGYGLAGVSPVTTKCLDWKDSDTWKPSYSYVVNDLVIQDGNVYKCKEAHISGETFEITNWDIQPGYTNKISLTSNSVPNNFFNLKVNIASSENVNNALLLKRFNDFLPYISPAKARDNRIKNDMEFVPAVLFVRENDADLTKHREFNDTDWHFYALGNIGDSKKTDYTRAYDPDDMNEFTLEISDNNKNNSLFLTGMYLDSNGHRQFETYEIVEDVDDDNKPLGTYHASSTMALAINTDQYIYPLDYETEWTAIDNETGLPKNMRYWSLMNEEFDGDHSFELRYACKGDYRDGKVVNDTTGQASALLALNKKVWQAFYGWLVTSDDVTFKAEIEQWCVKSAVEFFYAFTHYYTMMDNRAKNTFWHFAKTGTHRQVIHPLADLLHIYDEFIDNQYVRTQDTEIDLSKTYYTEYAFDLWNYDNDTALGINNNGELIFPYGKEDTDYRVTDDPSSGYVFNGAGSLFWRRLRGNFNNEIKDTFTTANNSCFNAEHLILQFDNFQECFPESLWNLDIKRKYIRSFTGENFDNAKTRQNVRFLRDMMQGRKKYLRRLWVKDLGVYFGSKYLLNNISDDVSQIRCYTPDASSATASAVPAKWDITLTPYLDMYLNVSYSGTYTAPIRARAGQRYEILYPSGSTSLTDSIVNIYGGSHIQAIEGSAIRTNGEITGAEGLASLYIGANDIKTQRLRRLILGTNNTDYSNGNFTSLNLPRNNPILETLDILNYGNLSGALDLSESTNLKEIEARGTAITQVMLPANTGIETLHLPNTINTITLINAKLLDEIILVTRNNVTDYSNLSSLIINNSDYSDNINWMDIAANALSHLSTALLLNLNKAHITNINELEPFAEKRNSIGNPNLINLSGVLNVTGDWSEIEKTTYETIWNNLTLNTLEINKKVRYLVTYKYDDNTNNGLVLYTTYVPADTYIEDAYLQGWLPEAHTPPTKPADSGYTYSFGSKNPSNLYIENSGWRRQGSLNTVAAESLSGVAPKINNDTILETVFTQTPRTYQVKWYAKKNSDGTPNIGTLVYTSTNVEYGHGETLEAPTVMLVREAGINTASASVTTTTATYEIFTGWEKLPLNINPDISSTSFDICGTWSTGTNVPLTTLFANFDNPTPEQLLVLSKMSPDLRTTILGENNISNCTTLDITTGYDSAENGTLIIGAGSTAPLYNARGTLITDQSIHNTARFDDASTTAPFRTNILPLSLGNDAFTLAIDFSIITPENASPSLKEFVLVSCYDDNIANNTATGFKIFYSTDSNAPGPRISFGDTFRNNGRSTYSKSLGSNNSTNPYGRRMIVIRHPANSNSLYVYSGNNGDNIYSTLDNNNFVQTLTWNNPNTDAYLTFGTITLEDITEHDTLQVVGAGKGIIYWAKYWNKDLGAGESKQLATWSHEQIKFGLEDYVGMDNRIVYTRTGVSHPSLVFTSLSSSQYGKILPVAGGSTEGQSYGWTNSEFRTLVNNRIFNSLPIKIQSIISLSPLTTTFSKYHRDDYYSTTSYDVNESGSYTNDLIFVPAVAELIENASEKLNSAVYGNEAAGIMKWNVGLNMIVHTYDNSAGSGGTWSISNNSSDLNANNGYYMNLRFPWVSISTTSLNNIYINYTGTTSIYSSIKNSDYSSTSVPRGTIFIATTGEAYIYVTSADVIAGAPIVIASSGLFSCPDGGGWVRADIWYSRSVFNQSRNSNIYIYTDVRGNVIYLSSDYASLSLGGLIYSFGI